MKKTNETTKDQTPKTTAEPKAAKAKKATAATAIEKPADQPAPKPAKAEKPPKVAKADTDGEVTDRLPTTLDELKETKGGFVAHLFLTGKDKDAIAKELAAAFKLADAQAVKITRRITGRVRLYARVFELVPAKK